MQNRTTSFHGVVLQPTSLCNLNCGYCYLPDRLTRNTMTVDVADAITKSIKKLSHPVSVVWHGGEPLACGINRFRSLLMPFESLRRQKKIYHSIQTNATLINDKWCRLLREKEIRIGVSLDGNREQNAERVNWNKKESFAKVIQGIETLKRHNIAFGVIAVVNPRNVDDVRLFYRFFSELGCKALNINIEEREGVNQSRAQLDPDRVRKFWQELFEIWKENPVIRIREFHSVLRWLKSRSSKDTEPSEEPTRDFWPTIAFNGDVVVLSPELAFAPKEERSRFVIGNILSESLTSILHKSLSSWYVRDFFVGVEKCRGSCPYYDYCGGGQASNKHFELGDVSGTETAYCRNTRQFVVDAILQSLEKRAERR